MLSIVLLSFDRFSFFFEQVIHHLLIVLCRYDFYLYAYKIYLYPLLYCYI